MFVSGLLGFAALLAMVPASASAAGPTTCDAREFCIGRGHHLSGGLYQNPENDNTFVDNVFLPSGGHVENNHRSVYNHGKAQSNGYHDVIIYSERDWDGDSACITLGRLLPDLFVISVEQNDTAWYEDWTNEIKSFKWATHAQCTPHGVLIND